MRIPGYRLHPSTCQARVTINGRDHLLVPTVRMNRKRSTAGLSPSTLRPTKATTTASPTSCLDRRPAASVHEACPAVTTQDPPSTANMKLVVAPVLDPTAHCQRPSSEQLSTELSARKVDGGRSQERQYINKHMKLFLRCSSGSVVPTTSPARTSSPVNVWPTEERPVMVSERRRQ